MSLEMTEYHLIVMFKILKQSLLLFGLDFDNLGTMIYEFCRKKQTPE
jgi:hypothetical protein